MKFAIVAEEENAKITALLKAFSKRHANAFFQSAANLGLFIDKNKPYLFSENAFLSDVNGIFFQLSPVFTAFLEPFLFELVERGIYAQVEPQSYFLLSNEPYLFHVLNKKEVRIPSTTIFGDVGSVQRHLKKLGFPCYVGIYKGTQRTHSTYCENVASLKSVIASMPKEVDCIMLREQPKGPLVKNIVIGEKVFSSQFDSLSQEFGYAKKGKLVKLGENESENIVQAASATGLEIATVQSVGKQVVGISALVDLEEMGKTVSQDLYGLVAQFFVERMK